MKEFYNLRWYIQHLVDLNEYQYGDNEWTNPLQDLQNKQAIHELCKFHFKGNDSCTNEDESYKTNYQS